MTKLLYCEDCSDIVAPIPEAGRPRFCRCEKHAVWWVDPYKGILRLWSRERSETMETFEDVGQVYTAPSRSWRQRAFILGLHNHFLTHPVKHTKESIRDIIDDTPDTYLFKTLNTLILRIRPGESNDTAWADTLGGIT